MSEGDLEFRSLWKYLFQTPFEQGWVDLGGVRTRYIRAGNPTAPALVMLHGTSGSLDTFAPTIAAHSKDFQCFAFDMIGSGFSDKPDRDYEIADYVTHTLNFLDYFNINRASFIGVSLGAWVSCRFACNCPERTNRLVLLSPSGLLVDLTTLNRMQTQRSKVVDNPTWENSYETITRLVYDPKSVIDDIVAIRQAIYQLPNAERSMAHVLILTDPEVRRRNNLTEDEWRSIEAPMLVVVSVDAGDMWTASGYGIGKLAPQARVLEMTEVSHWPHFEKPDEFNAASLAFLSEG